MDDPKSDSPYRYRGPTTGSTIPDPPGPPWQPVPRSRSRRLRWGLRAGCSLIVVAALFVVIGSRVHVDYYTEAPGDAVAVQPLVSIDGAPSYESDGTFMLLFIRRGDRINLLRYIQASLDPDIDVKKADYSQPGQSPADLDAISASDMAQAQLAARKLALERVGEEVEILDGMQVTSVVAGRPAAGVLEPGDVIVALNGRKVGPGDESGVISAVLGELKPGDVVSIRYERDGDSNTVEIDTVDNGAGRALIGLLMEPNVRYPFGIAFEGRIESIGGPSAGLAMTLALLDELTPGELTGGTNVAVTGAIDIEGGVHEVGRVDLKAKAARRRDATLMLVPECSEPEPRDAYETDAHYQAAVDFYESCEAEVRRARDSIDTVIEVATLDEALEALAAHGGDELPPVAATTTVPA